MFIHFKRSKNFMKDGFKGLEKLADNLKNLGGEQKFFRYFI